MAIPLYLLKSSISLQFLELFSQPNETTHWSTDVNRLVERLEQLLEIIAIMKRKKNLILESLPETDHLGSNGLAEQIDGSGEAVFRLFPALVGRRHRGGASNQEFGSVDAEPRIVLAEWWAAARPRSSRRRPGRRRSSR